MKIGSIETRNQAAFKGIKNLAGGETELMVEKTHMGTGFHLIGELTNDEANSLDVFRKMIARDKEELLWPLVNGKYLQLDGFMSCANSEEFWLFVNGKKLDYKEPANEPILDFVTNILYQCYPVKEKLMGKKLLPEQFVRNHREITFWNLYEPFSINPKALCDSKTISKAISFIGEISEKAIAQIIAKRN